MPHDAREPSVPDLAAAAPSAAVRERVLDRCRQEMAARRVRERHRRRVQRWGLAVSVAGLLLLNLLEEHRSATQIAVLVAGRAPMAWAGEPRFGAQRQRSHASDQWRRGNPGPGPGAVAPPTIVSLRARATLLAALLRDPSAL